MLLFRASHGKLVLVVFFAVILTLAPSTGLLAGGGSKCPCFKAASIVAKSKKADTCDADTTFDCTYIIGGDCVAHIFTYQDGDPLTNWYAYSVAMNWVSNYFNCYLHVDGILKKSFNCTLTEDGCAELQDACLEEIYEAFELLSEEEGDICF